MTRRRTRSRAEFVAGDLYNKEVEGKSYLLKKVVRFRRMEVESARVPARKNGSARRAQVEEVPVEKPKDAAEPKKKPISRPTAAGERRTKAERKEARGEEEYFVATSERHEGREVRSTARAIPSNQKTIDDASRSRRTRRVRLDKAAAQGDDHQEEDAPTGARRLSRHLRQHEEGREGREQGYYAAVDTDGKRGTSLYQTTFDSWNKEMKDFRRSRRRGEAEPTPRRLRQSPGPGAPASRRPDR
jgi:hypothetical protein